MGPVFLLVGAPAVGKSTTAHALAARFPKSLHIPVDNLRDMVVSGMVYPGAHWPPELTEQLALARRAAVQMALTYGAAGFAVTIDDFWDPFSRLSEYTPLLEQADVHRVLLYPTAEVAQARNLQRSGLGDAVAYIAEGIRLVYDSLTPEVNPLRAAGWHVVDTTDLDVEATVTCILERNSHP